MVNIGVLDLALVVGVVALGWFLAIYFKSKYKISKRDFLAGSFYVAGLTAIIIAAYHILRGMLFLSP